ncbi:hypothetical protein PENTCL1PPCAC_8425, partial [Pristionchus entomophagus]
RFLTMIYQWRIFTHRICCMQAMSATFLMAILTIMVDVLTPLLMMGPVFYNSMINVSIQVSILVLEVMAAATFVIACCALEPFMIMLSIIIQILSDILCTVVLPILMVNYAQNIDLTNYPKVSERWYLAISLILSLPNIYCLICSYKFILYKKHTRLSYHSHPFNHF